MNNFEYARVSTVADALKSKSRSWMKLATGVTCVSSTARVRAVEISCRASPDAATTMSVANNRSVAPAGMRCAAMASGARASSRCISAMPLVSGIEMSSTSTSGVCSMKLRYA